MTASPRDLERERAFDLIDLVHTFKDYGVNPILEELKVMNPDLYHNIENHFKFKETDKKLGALLESHSMRGT